MIDTMIFKENHKINYHSPLHLSKSLEMLFFLPGVDQTPPTSPMIAHLIQPLPWMSDTYQPKRRMIAMASATDPEGFYCSMSRKFILFGKDGDGDYLSDGGISAQDC